MEEKWINDIRNKMADYRAPLPDGLLEQAKREALRRQGHAAQDKRRAILIPLWSKVAVAAMAVVVCCLSAWLFLREEAAPVPMAVRETPGKELEEPALVASEKRESILGEPVRNVYPSRLTSRTLSEPLLAQALPTNTETEEPIPEEPTKEVTPAPMPQSPKQKPRVTSPSKQRGYGTESLMPQRRDRGGLGLSGYVTGAFGNSGGNVYGTLVSQSFSNSGMEHDQGMPIAYATGKSELLTSSESASHTTHHQPIKAGVSLRIPISPRWSVSTGITYSYLSSDMSHANGTTKMETKQKLHYVGVPINANYSVWRTNRLNLYASAGVEVEKLVSGQQDTDHYEGGTFTQSTSQSVKESRPRFSGNVAIGAEYRLVGQLSVYAEPGMVYHFDNGSDVESSYTDKRFNLNVQVGLRWELK